jgi:hypothetical protein
MRYAPDRILHLIQIGQYLVRRRFNVQLIPSKDTSALICGGTKCQIQYDRLQRPVPGVLIRINLLLIDAHLYQSSL